MKDATSRSWHRPLKPLFSGEPMGITSTALRGKLTSTHCTRQIITTLRQARLLGAIVAASGRRDAPRENRNSLADQR